MGTGYMELLTISLKNFRSHVDTNIDFTKLSTPMVIKGVNKDRTQDRASNGAGKSSIFDAITYALFGVGKDFLRTGTDSGGVILTFRHAGADYTIEKNFTVKDYTIKLYRDGVIISEQKLEAITTIRELIGISKPIYDQTIYQEQGFTNFFGGMSNNYKSQMLMEILEIDQWEKYHAVTKVQLKLINEQTTKTNTKKEVKLLDLEKLNKELAQIDIVSLNKAYSTQVELLNSKQQLLQSYAQTEFLESQLLAGKPQLERGNSYLSTLRKNIHAAKDTIAKYTDIVNGIISKELVPIDEKIRADVKANALIIEKAIAAKETELSLKATELDTFDKKLPVIMAQAVCPFCRKSMEPEYKAQLEIHLSGERAQLVSEIEKIREDCGKLMLRRSDITSQSAALDKQATIYLESVSTRSQAETILSQAQSALTEYMTQLPDAEALVRTMTDELNSITAILSSQNLSSVGILRQDIVTIQDKVNVLKEKLDSVAPLQLRIKDLEQELAQIDVELTRYNSAVDTLKHIQYIFSTNGIQKWLFTQALVELSAMTNSLLNTIDLSVGFQLEKSKKLGEGFKPVFDIVVTRNSTGSVYTFDGLSGGERELINFALRLALSSLIAMRSDFKFMIIDEGFQNLDEPYREDIATLLKQLSSQFQIFLVTHFPDLEGEFENVMNIVKEHDISHVEISGGA